MHTLPTYITRYIGLKWDKLQEEGKTNYLVKGEYITRWQEKNTKKIQNNFWGLHEEGMRAFYVQHHKEIVMDFCCAITLKHLIAPFLMKFEQIYSLYPLSR